MAAITDKNFTISPRYKASQWLALTLLQKDAADWQTAVDIFEDRISGRFIQQIDVLAANPKRDIGEFAGFAILAMDCLLIESLQQFYLGIQFTPQRQGNKLFHDFF